MTYTENELNHVIESTMNAHGEWPLLKEDISHAKLLTLEAMEADGYVRISLSRCGPLGIYDGRSHLRLTDKAYEYYQNIIDGEAHSGPR